MDELKACPFCGLAPKTEKTGPANHYVVCLKCALTFGPYVHGGQAAAVWNRRADDAGRLREVLALAVELMTAFHLEKYAMSTAANAVLSKLISRLTSLASLPASPSAEPCFRDAAGWCSTHTRQSDECGPVNTPKPAPSAEPRLTGRECRICAGKMVDFNAHYDRCFSCNAPEPKPAHPGEGGL